MCQQVMRVWVTLTKSDDICNLRVFDVIFIYSKRKTFAYHLCNVGPMSKTLYKCYTNGLVFTGFTPVNTSLQEFILRMNQMVVTSY